MFAKRQQIQTCMFLFKIVDLSLLVCDLSGQEILTEFDGDSAKTKGRKTFVLSRR